VVEVGGPKLNEACPSGNHKESGCRLCIDGRLDFSCWSRVSGAEESPCADKLSCRYMQKV
jgi:hypothetical protein